MLKNVPLHLQALLPGNALRRAENDIQKFKTSHPKSQPTLDPKGFGKRC